MAITETVKSELLPNHAVGSTTGSTGESQKVAQDCPKTLRRGPCSAVDSPVVAWLGFAPILTPESANLDSFLDGGAVGFRSCRKDGHHHYSRARLLETDFI